MSAKARKTTFTEEDIYLFRLRKMTEVSKAVMQHVFSEGTKERPSNLSLFEFYKSKGVSVKAFQKNLNKKQIEKIVNDPEGKSFDITLLFHCIRWGCKGVAGPNDEKWTKSSYCLESLLTSLKNKRNEINHDDISYNKEGFFKEIEELRKLLTKTLYHAGKLYQIPRINTRALMKDMNYSINIFRDDSFVPLDWNTYKKHNFFSSKQNLIRVKGFMILSQIYNEWVFVTPTSLLCSIVFKVNYIYTKMVLIDASEPEKKTQVKFEDLLHGIKHRTQDPVILIEGEPGVGKTTLTKKILHGWISSKSSVRKLSDYDLLFYAECRDSSIKSFQDLVTAHLQTLANSFQVDDFVKVIQSLKVIIIIDGFDEINQSSKLLFRNVLDLKKTTGLTVLVTTRPEKVKTYLNMTRDRNIKTKRIMLTGIPSERREEFVKKYFDQIKLKIETDQDIKGLLEYLKRTARRLSHLWNLPYNLTLLTLLWVYRSKTVNSITTAPELYWQIYQLSINKLVERLLYNDDIHLVSESSIKLKCNNFIYKLSYEALHGLVHDNINLSEESFKRLEDVCTLMGLPPDEMTGTFLKKTVTRNNITKYSFSHKGQQEFFGALYIFMKTKVKIGDDAVPEILRIFRETLEVHNVSEEVGQDILKYSRDRLNKTSQDSIPLISNGESVQQLCKVRDVIEELGDSNPDFTKYRNLLVTLIGLFHVNNFSIADNIKQGILELLRETGIDSREDWLKILDSVKCDKFVADFVSEQYNVYKDNVEINDSTLHAHISLMQALKTPSQEAHSVEISIKIKNETSGINELLEEIAIKKFNVQKLYFQPDFRCPARPVISDASLNKVLKRSTMSYYQGSVTPEMHPPKSIKSLFVSVSDEERYEQLITIMENRVQWISIDLCFLPSIQLHYPRPLPRAIRFLYIPDISNYTDITKALVVIRKTNTQNFKFRRIYFPRLSHTLGIKGISDIIEEMKAIQVEVEEYLILPTKLKPSSKEEDALLKRTAIEKLKCKQGILWDRDEMGFSIDDWE